MKIFRREGNEKGLFWIEDGEIKFDIESDELLKIIISGPKGIEKDPVRYFNFIVSKFILSSTIFLQPEARDNEYLNGESMIAEKKKVEELFAELCRQPVRRFPEKKGEHLIAPVEQGVYVIREDDIILHVGRTLSAQKGLSQRLKDHLQGKSSFTREYLKGENDLLRDGRHTYKTLVVENPRLRALLEAYAIGTLCPKHIGVGVARR